jgi:hypothetical protein
MPKITLPLYIGTRTVAKSALITYDDDTTNVTGSISCFLNTMISRYLGCMGGVKLWAKGKSGEHATDPLNLKLAGLQVWVKGGAGRARREAWWGSGWQVGEAWASRVLGEHWR